MGERAAHYRSALLGAAAIAILALPVLSLTAQPAPAPSLLPEAFRTAPPPPSAAAQPLPGVTTSPAPSPNTPASNAPSPNAPVPSAGAPDAAQPGEQPLPGTEAGSTQPPLLQAPLQNGIDPLAGAPLQNALRIGLYPAGQQGWSDSAFASSNGRFLAALMRRLQAPTASRWATISLRNALLTQADAPKAINSGDWVAARAGLLMRMGEIDGARALLDAMPIEANTAAASRVAGQAAMAAADIGALCPVARTGRQQSSDILWELALGMCAALEGDDISAAALFDSLRNRVTGVSPFDLRLAEGIAAAAGSGGRATNIAWSEAPPLTPYRFGVATASGVAIPDDALGALGPARHGWIVRQPGIAAAQRLAAFGPAAVQGTVSASEYVSAVSALAADGDAASPAALLRTAFAGGGAGQRVAAMKAIWATPVPGLSQEAARYAGYIQTAAAAARLPVTDDVAADSADIIASLLTSGNAGAARRWWPVARDAGGIVEARAWALLAAGGALAATPDAFDNWRDETGADDAAAGRLLGALKGLGVTADGGWPDDFVPTSNSSWSRAISAAAAAGRSGEVMVLVATGLQGAWREVPPQHLLHITQALTKSGQRSVARRIAAEAVTRG